VEKTVVVINKFEELVKVKKERKKKRLL